MGAELREPSLVLMIAAIMSVIGSGCHNSGPAQVAPAIPDSRVVALFGGPEGYEILAHATQVKAFRIGDPVEVKDANGKFRFESSETAGPVTLPEDAVKLLKSKLTDPNSYGWDFGKGCKFQPGVRFEFVRADVRLQILVCFSCDQIMALLNGKRIAGEDFDSIRPTLLQVAQQAFPDDAEIQALKP